MQKFIERIKIDRKFLLIVIGFVIATLFFFYITIPALIIWWFYKKSKFSKKAKIITTSTIGGLFAILLVWFGIAYASDAQPSLTITQPSALTTSIKTPQITIQGTYTPSDRIVQVNGQDISTSHGTFSTVYQLQKGENKVTIQAGRIRWAYAYLTINRELTDAEKAALITPTATPKAAITIKPTITPTEAISKPSVTLKPTTSAVDKAQIRAVLTTNVNHFNQIWIDGHAALGTTQYPDATSGLEALNNDPTSNASLFSQFKQKEDPAQDSTYIGVVNQAYGFSNDPVTFGQITKWNGDMGYLTAAMENWVGDATGWQISSVSTDQLNTDEQKVKNDFTTVKQDIQAIQ